MGLEGLSGAVALQLSPECPILQLRKEVWLGGPSALGPSLAQRLLGQPRKPAGWASISPCPSLPPTPQGHSEMSFLQLSGAEVTPAQQITLKVEQCPPARQGQGWGQWVGGQHQAGWELLPGVSGGWEWQRGRPKGLPK